MDRVIEREIYSWEQPYSACVREPERNRLSSNAYIWKFGGTDEHTYLVFFPPSDLLRCPEMQIKRMCAINLPPHFKQVKTPPTKKWSNCGTHLRQREFGRATLAFMAAVLEGVCVAQALWNLQRFNSLIPDLYPRPEYGIEVVG